MSPLRRMSLGPLARVPPILVLAAMYVALGKLGLALSPVSGFATLVWPPTGLSIAALLLRGRGLWPGVALGALVTNLWTGATPAVALGIALGNTLEAVAATWGLDRVPGFRRALDRFADVAALAVTAAVLCSPLAATFGTGSLFLGGFVAAPALARTWIAWWTGDLMSALVVAPALLSWASAPPLPRSRRGLPGAAARAVVLVAAAALVFLLPPEIPRAIPILQPYSLFLPLLWAALSRGTRGASAGVLAVAVVAVIGTYLGRGALAEDDPLASLTALHVFLAAASAASLALGAAVGERERAQAERAALAGREQAALAEAARAKDEFLAVLSHELRTPLQAMLGWIQIIRAPETSAELLQKGLATIERNVEAQRRLVEDLLDVSRIVAGKMVLASQRIDLADVAAPAVDSARAAASAKAVRLEATTDEPGAVVVGDPERLRQVIANLLANAVKFTPAGGCVRVRVDRAGGAARIVVADTGCGIHPDLLPRIFDRFRQGGSASARAAAGGLGLGLAIARHIAEAHGGGVVAESAGEGQGATFTFTLPLAPAEVAAGADAAAPLRGPAAHDELDGARILVVDDDPSARELVGAMLSASGADVRVEASAGGALRALDAFHPQLLVSDLGMPGEDGFSLLRRVRAREVVEGGHLPAIALTGLAAPADRERALAVGFEAHLAKPVSVGELSRAAARLLGAHRAR